jgi:hypothetical protein
MIGVLVLLKENRSVPDPVHKVFFLEEWFFRKAVFEEVFQPYFREHHRVLFDQLSQHKGSLSDWNKIWEGHFFDLLTRGSQPPCKRCSALKARSQSSTNSEAVRTQARRELLEHQTNYVKHNAAVNALSVGAGSAVHFYIDYKEGVSLTRLSPNPPSLSMQSNFKYLIGGYIYVLNGQRFCDYLVHTSHWTESANTIVSSLHHIFTQWRHGDRPEVLYLTADNHSTNKNWTVICYFYILVVFFRMFAKIVFALTWPNHGKGPADQGHQGIGVQVYSAKYIASLQQMADLCASASDTHGRRVYTGTALEDIWDWKGFFERGPFTKPSNIQINGQVYTDPIDGFLVFTFTQSGVTFRESLLPIHKESNPIELFPSDYGSTLNRSRLSRAQPSLMTRDASGRITDSRQSGLRAGIQQIGSAYPSVDTTWAQSVLDETWPALHNTSKRPIIPPGCTFTHRPIQRPDPSKPIRAGEHAFVSWPGSRFPALAEIQDAAPTTNWFKGAVFFFLFFVSGRPLTTLFLQLGFVNGDLQRRVTSWLDVCRSFLRSACTQNPSKCASKMAC